jgi:hypothetical protein
MSVVKTDFRDAVQDERPEQNQKWETKSTGLTEKQNSLIETHIRVCYEET